jgi:hypothetical protein
MNIAKHMEAIFVISVALACGTTYAVDTIPAFHNATAMGAESAIPTVTVSAKRLNAAEKAQSVS